MHTIQRSSNLFLLYLLLLSSPTRAASTPIEQPAIPSGALLTSNGTSAEASVSASLDKGNSNQIAVQLESQWRMRHNKHHFAFNITGGFAHSEGTVQVGQTFEQFSYHYNFLTYLALEAFIQHQFDQLAGIESRLMPAIGPVFTLNPIEDLTLLIGVALGYEYVWITPGLEANDFKNSKLRFINYLNFSWAISKSIKVSDTFYIEPDLLNMRDYRIRNSLSLELAANPWISLSLTLSNTYWNTPLPDKKPLDTSLSTALIFHYESLAQSSETKPTSP